MIKEYKGKLEGKGTTDLLEKFTGFDGEANFIKTKEKIKRKEESKNYFKFLERLKTVKEYSIDGKKLFIKFNLKLKENCEDKLI